MAITYATWNPVDKHANVALSWGNLIATSSLPAAWANCRATIWVSSGKWYWELKTTWGTVETMVAIATSAAALGWSGTTFPWSDAFGFGYYGNGGSKFNNNVGSWYGWSFSTNIVIWVALDMNAGTLQFYNNNVLQGTAFTGLSGTYYPMVGLDANGQAVTANFWASAFQFTPPSGFNAWIYTSSNTSMFSFF